MLAQMRTVNDKKRIREKQDRNWNCTKIIKAKKRKEKQQRKKIKNEN